MELFSKKCGSREEMTLKASFIFYKVYFEKRLNDNIYNINNGKIDLKSKKNK
jgi:hypothetical protein